ncbi:MAG TPA: quinolinate synthase NadA [bacterium]|nr:quinolinate synthase NadA [bacterium]
MDDTIRRIAALKKDKNAIILAHTYTRPEVQDIADVVGDSFELAVRAADSAAEIIVLAGVRFMGETAAILTPGRTVLLPVADAGCPLADMITPEQVRQLKAQYPGAAVACYVNSSVEVKALSDVCVTSSSAVRIVRNLPAKQVIFVPDRNLGSWVAEQVPEKDIILHSGFCPVHHKVSPEDVRKVKARHPGAVVLMHPECMKETRAEADHILSTGGMVALVKEKKHERYIVVTESGITHTLRRHDPAAEFIDLSNPTMYCQNMKKITIETILRSLDEGGTAVTVASDIAEKARYALSRMLELNR